MHLPFDGVRYSPNAISTLFFMADVKCGLYEINKNNRANATHGLSLVQKIFKSEPKRFLIWTGEVPDQDLNLY